MNSIYLYSTIDDDESASGERKKVDMQVQAFRDLGYDVELIVEKKNHKAIRILARMPGSYAYSKKTRNQVLDSINEDTEFIYIRKFLIDNSFLKLLKDIKKKTRIKVFLEIPTYPYDKEWGRVIDAPMLWKERFFRKRIKRYVDRIITLDNSDVIFGVPCIRIVNGIGKTSIKPKKSIHNEGEIHLLAVALFQPAHGYERLLEGLKNYYEKEHRSKIIFHLVGNGAKELYGDLIDSYGLNKYVVIHGSLYGAELDRMYDECQLGISPLGPYKVGLIDVSSLKSVEYCSRGLPFIYAGNDIRFEKKDFKYAMKVENNGTCIDVEDMIHFYEQLPDDETVTKEMIEYAYENLEWTNIMRNVVNTL